MLLQEGTDPVLRRALGLFADDFSFLSIRGASTQANEKNEVRMLNTILKTLDCAPGNAVSIVRIRCLERDGLP